MYRKLCFLSGPAETMFININKYVDLLKDTLFLNVTFEGIQVMRIFSKLIWFSEVCLGWQSFLTNFCIMLIKKKGGRVQILNTVRRSA